LHHKHTTKETLTNLNTEPPTTNSATTGTTTRPTMCPTLRPYVVYRNKNRNVYKNSIYVLPTTLTKITFEKWPRRNRCTVPLSHQKDALIFMSYLKHCVSKTKSQKIFVFNAQ